MEWLASPWIFATISVLSSLLAFIIYRVGYMKASKGVIEIGKIKEEETKKVSPHTMCPNARDIMEVIHRTLEYSERRSDLKNQLIEDQMRYYEETEEEVLGEFKRIFLSLLSDKLKDIDSYVQHPEYTAYTVTLKAIASELKSYIRSCFKSNHYATLEPEEQRQYIDKKKSIIEQKITESLNMFWRGTAINRSELYKENQKNINVLYSYAESIFNRAFLLARETKNELEKMESEYNRYITATIGNNGAINTNV